MRRLGHGLTALALAVLAAGCSGGGDSDVTPAADVRAVKVIGDSLADAGTYGFKFTVQGTADAPSWLYVERVALDYGLTPTCARFRYTGSGFTTSTDTACANYAIGGSVIHPASAGLGASDPRGLAVQFAAARAAGLAATDLLMVDGGGNDAAALIGAWLRASRDGAAAYTGLLATLLDAGTVASGAAAGSSGLAALGVPYMQALADRMSTLVREQALAGGARRVLVADIPGITKTPRFQTVLDGVASAYGGGTAGATARAQAEALFQSWIVAYNSRLAANFSGESRVLVVDVYTSFNEQVATPAQFGLDDVTTPVCPATGTDASGLPTYTFATCTAAALSASPPSGAGADWWRRHAFADNFHPTPWLHQLTGQLMARALARAGWL